MIIKKHCHHFSIVDRLKEHLEWQELRYDTAALECSLYFQSLFYVHIDSKLTKHLTSWSRVLSESHEIPCLVWNLMVQYSIHQKAAIGFFYKPYESSPQSLSNFFNINFNIILPSISMLSNQNYVCISHVSHMFCMLQPSHP